MAPDADKLRQRKPLTGSSIISTEEQQDNAATEERIGTLKGLKGGEVVIDGVIYDILSFHHPGGDAINIFGGNDATIQYKMIHPYHTEKHLEKMRRVGTVPDYHSE
jgi:fatty acid desaturase (delta-4 desaturase)